VLEQCRLSFLDLVAEVPARGRFVGGRSRFLGRRSGIVGGRLRARDADEQRAKQ
jgi:hypothetical protein